MDLVSDDISQPLFPNILNQQGAGTRQTVYYNNEPKTEVPETSGQDPPISNQTFLVYNRVNTTLGGEILGQRPTAPSPDNSVRSNRSQQTMAPKISPSDDPKRKTRKENDMWYEYGCV